MSKPTVARANSKAARLAAWLAERQPTVVELQDFQALLQKLQPIEENELRRLLRASGAPLHPLVAGVDQSDFHSLAASLLALQAEYDRGGAETRQLVRHIIITSKDHAKLAARNRRVEAFKREVKQQMAEWLLIWLENPAIFPDWVQKRLQVIENQPPPL